MTRHAEDPFLIGQEVIWQGCDWLTRVMVSIQIKPAKTLKFPSFFIVISFLLRSWGVLTHNRFCEKDFAALPHATTTADRSLPFKFEGKRGKS
jgi:hypothetical protein